ncbi:MAG: cadherin-like domain-containing protein, partial [Psychrosphaera sp.]|nr:cadherin-like domain-containing protein [Psychrosphaera sp.]
MTVVVEGNDTRPPNAHRDEFVVDQDSPGAELDVLANDEDLDGDDLFLQSAQTNYGGVAVNDNKLRFVPDEGFAGDVIIHYLVADPSGETDTAQVLLSVEDNSSVNDPTIDPPEDISIIASGRLTKVELGSAIAMDMNGNMIPVELLNARRSYPPGAHNVFWKATDKEGRVVIASQKVNIYPLVSITKGQLVEEGSEAVIEVTLNGLSPAYPIVIPYTVHSEATAGIDFELTDGEIRINEGTKTELRFATYRDDILEGPEDILIVLGDTPYKTNEFIHKATIVETNIKPRISLLTTQDNEPRFLIERTGDEVTVTATISDGNKSDSHIIEWLPGDGITRTNDQADLDFTFAVLDMTAGIYQMGAKVTDNGAGILSAQTEIYIELVDELPTLGSGDTDGDLLSDVAEGYADDDADHIPNYLDPISDCNLIPEQANTVEHFLIEGQSGGCLRRGPYTTAGQSNGVMIDDSQSPLPADADTNNVGGLFDFVVFDIKDDSGTYSIVIPQRQPVPQDAIYRKYSPDKGWYTFVQDDNNSLWSTPGSAGICPPPKDDAWVSGLHVGDWCVQITIEDGGANDDDGLVNNTISDPGGISVYNSSNNFPVALDDLGELSWNSTAHFEVLSNDTDADDDSLEVINAQAELGSVEVDNGMTLRYTALENFVGEDRVNYSISDGHGGIATAILRLTVKGNNAPDANNDTASTTNNLAITINALSNDTDEDGDALTITEASADFGTVTITGNKLLYTPKAAFEGTVTVTYAIEDSAGATDEA